MLLTRKDFFSHFSLYNHHFLEMKSNDIIPFFNLYFQDPSNMLLTKNNDLKLYNFGLGHMTGYGKVVFQTDSKVFDKK
jgi:hypothetical protein